LGALEENVRGSYESLQGKVEGGKGGLKFKVLRILISYAGAMEE